MCLIIIQPEFEVIFREYDENVEFNYLKSFNRVRVTYSSVEFAELARANLNSCRFQGSSLKVRPVVVCLILYSFMDCGLYVCFLIVNHTHTHTHILANKNW